MKPNGLGKSHKLCSKVAIDRLFARRDPDTSLLAYPLRAVWSTNPDRTTGQPVQFLITVPKKRLRHAVDRVTMRRRIREAYRLLRPQLLPTPSLPNSPSTLPAATTPPASSTALPIDLAFIYIADTLEPYARVEKAMRRILLKLPR